jgi:hypothetical protein
MKNYLEILRGDKRELIAITLAVIIITVSGVLVLRRGEETEGPVPATPDIVVGEGINETPFPLSVPDGFRLEVFAEVEDARVLARDGFGNF